MWHSIMLSEADRGSELATAFRRNLVNRAETDVARRRREREFDLLRLGSDRSNRKPSVKLHGWMGNRRVAFACQQSASHEFRSFFQKEWAVLRKSDNCRCHTFYWFHGAKTVRPWNHLQHCYRLFMYLFHHTLLKLASTTLILTAFIEQTQKNHSFCGYIIAEDVVLEGWGCSWNICSLIFYLHVKSPLIFAMSVRI